MKTIRTIMALCALCLGVLCAQDELLVLVPVKAAPNAQTTVIVQGQDAHPHNVKEAYDRWFQIANSIMVDSPSGPKPALGLDNVYDSNGMPIPRLPDPYSYALLQDPTNQEAITQYLDWRKAAIRRIMMAANEMPDEAMKRGIITSEVLAMQAPRPTDQHLTGDLSRITKDSLGTRLVSDGEARSKGVEKRDEIPLLPGEASESGIEVYWFWHHRCPFCTQMARTWFEFQQQVNAAGYKAMSINMSPLRTKGEIESASYEVSGLLEMWQVTWGESVEHSRNWFDWTELAKSMRVEGTPTTIFVNRKTLEIVRLVGAQEPENLRASLAQVGGWSVDQWPPPLAAAKVAGEDAEATKPAVATSPGVTSLRKLYGE